MVEILIYSIYFIVGAVVGSFANVVAYRLPLGISLNNPPSTCFNCGKQIKWYENIPIFAYLFLKGKCSSCKCKIPFRDFLVEVICAGLFLAVGMVFYSQSLVGSIFLCLCVAVLIILSCIDLDHLYLPSSLLIAFCIFTVGVACSGIFGSIWDHIIGLLVGGGFLLLVYGVGYLIKKREVVGIGDIKLMAIAGLMIGWKGVLFAYLVGFILASIILLMIRLVTKNKEKNKEYPFAPYLVAGIIISIFVGNLVFDWYLSLFLI